MPMRSPSKRARFSLEALGLGHRAYVVFLLGSVVPLALLALLTDRYVVSQVEDARALGMIVAVVLVAILAILSFVVLARTTAETVGRLESYGDRQSVLLKAAHSFADAAFVDVIAERTTQAATELISASMGFTFLDCLSGDHDASHVAAWGNDASRLLATRRAAVEELARAACRDQQALIVDQSNPALPGDLFRPADDHLTPIAALATPLIAHGASFGAIVLVRLSPAAPFSIDDSDVVLTLVRQAALALHGAKLQEAEQNFFTHVTEILVQALDLHVDHQEGHARRVAHYANQIGRELGLDSARLSRLFFAAVLHDIGMLRIDARQGVDRAAFREHCRLADEMLRPITLWSDIAPLVRHHHERHDGNGYPDGLQGETIPIESRIIALADTFDVLTAPGSYRPTIGTADALREIERCAGTQFDPEVVRAFLTLAGRGELEA
jgi:HD-GYP domain-containing protein (c-di-GMP phosphodiesterase class II)